MKKERPTFKVGDMVSTKPGVIPKRFFDEVTAVGTMMIHGEMQYAIRVHGLPYYPYELDLDLAWIE